MSFLKDLVGGGSKSNRPDIDALLVSDDPNAAIIELDNYVCEMCSWGEVVSKLTGPQRNFFLNQQLEREVNNGGFHQYFFNSSGDFALETVDSLRAIGAERTSDLLRSAIDQFPNGNVPRDADERQRLMLEIWPNGTNDEFIKMDVKFFEYQDPLNDLNLEYVKANRDAF